MPGSLTVIVPTVNRPTLPGTLRSADGADEVLVLPDPSPGRTANSNRLRDHGIAQASGDWILFMDDDDRYAPGVFDWIRDELTPGWHIFRMRYTNGITLWTDPSIHMGNVGTPMLVVPNRPDLPRWAAVDVYEGDFHFAVACQQLMGEPVWHEQVIAEIRPEP